MATCNSIRLVSDKIGGAEKVPGNSDPSKHPGNVNLTSKDSNIYANQID